jgi:hypothetical protein
MKEKMNTCIEKIRTSMLASLMIMDTTPIKDSFKL